MYKLLTCISFLLVITHVFAKEDKNVTTALGKKYTTVSYLDLTGGYYQVMLNGKLGACDLTGKEVVPCKYDCVVLQDGYYGVTLNNKMGACDLTGKEVIPCKYDFVVLQDDYYEVTLNDKMGACDLTGKEIVPCKYDFVNLHDGWYGVKLDGREGALDITGKEVVPCKYDLVVLTSNKYYVKLNNKEGYLDMKGNVITDVLENAEVEESGVKLFGNWSYNMDFSARIVTIKGDKIINKSTTVKSGTLGIMLYLTATKYTGGSINGYALASSKLDPLEAGESLDEIGGTLNFSSSPKSGSYYVTLLLVENTTGEFEICDYLSYDEPLAFESRKAERILNAIATGLTILNNSMIINNPNPDIYPTNTNSNVSSGHMGSVTCSFCHGTGYNPGKETISFGNERALSSTPCN